MNDYAALLAAVRSDPDDQSLSLGVVDWLCEHGTEDDWQTYLDHFPDHHRVRVRFGDWLGERGDVRAPGYRALGIGEYRPQRSLQNHPGNNRNFPQGCWEWWAVKNSLIPIESVLPSAWFDLIRTDFTYFIGGKKARSRDTLTRREAEDAAALAFPLLSESLRARLLGEGVRRE